METFEESISATKKEFETRFAEGKFYNMQMQDDSHLNAIINLLPIKPGMRILDIGTGSGYLSFALAKKYPDISVIGLDIVEDTLKSNQAKANYENISNIGFVNYSGRNFPFSDCEFDLIVSRYALHHFPDINYSLSEISRVLSKEGFFFISDAAPNENDAGRLIDKYMQLTQDGHIKFYTFDEWKSLCSKHRLDVLESFRSSVRFPRKSEMVYRKFISECDNNIINGYDIQIIGDLIYVTVQVNNILFHKVQFLL